MGEGEGGWEGGGWGGREGGGEGGREGVREGGRGRERGRDEGRREWEGRETIRGGCKVVISGMCEVANSALFTKTALGMNSLGGYCQVICRWIAIGLSLFVKHLNGSLGMPMEILH